MKGSCLCGAVAYEATAPKSGLHIGLMLGHILALIEPDAVGQHVDIAVPALDRDVIGRRLPA